MKNFKINEYINLYDPFKNNYLPVRILERNKDGYNVKALLNDRKFNIYDYQIENYGFQKNWISEKLLIKLGFEKNGLIYKLDDLIVWECLIGELQNIEHPYYLYEYSSKHLGYAIFKNELLIQFKNDFKNVQLNSKNNIIKDKYLITSSVNTLFESLTKITPEKYNYTIFDKLIINK